MNRLDRKMIRKQEMKGNNNKFLWAIFTFAAVIIIGTVVFFLVFLNKGEKQRTPEELLVEYINYIPEQKYQEMYAMIDIEASNNISQEDFIKRNSAIYEGIEVNNITVEVITYDKEQNTVIYQTSFDTVAGNVSFDN